MPDITTLIIYVVLGVGVAYIFSKYEQYDADEVEPESAQVIRKPKKKVKEESLYNPPATVKEYKLEDGSVLAIDEAKVQVEKKPVFDPFGEEILNPTKTPTERLGGGMAEIIRRRREEGVF